MNIKKTLCALIALLLIWTSGILVFAETRNIYIGDIITLQISSREFSAEELRERFRAFEIVDIKEERDGYLLSLRTFEIGEHRVLLGNKEIIINIHSTLDDIQREGLFEGDTVVIEAGFLIRWRVFFYTALCIFALSICFVLLKAFRKKNDKTLTPLQIFIRHSSSLSVENDGYFVDLTFNFKEYLESAFQCRIVGKTSAEIMSELKEVKMLSALLSDIKSWLMKCDILKFSGVKASIEIKQEHYKELLRLVEKIDVQNTQNEESA